MVIPRAKSLEDDLLFEECFFKEESALLLFPHKEPLHRYFCAYRDPRLKTMTNKSWNDFLKVWFHHDPCSEETAGYEQPTRAKRPLGCRLVTTAEVERRERREAAIQR